MRRVLIHLILAVLIFAVVISGRGIISSAFADVTLGIYGLQTGDYKEEARELSEKYELAVLEIEKREAQALENEELKRLLKIKSSADLLMVAARVISFGNNEDYRYLFADCGTGDGVYPGCCVISGNGFVGRVYECGDDWCGIKTVLSGDTEISVTCLGNGKTYLMSGGNPHLSFVSLEDDISPGDEVVTSGLSENIPKGLKVGRVYKVTGVSGAEKRAEVRCFERYKGISYVLICKGDEPSGKEN